MRAKTKTSITGSQEINNPLLDYLRNSLDTLLKQDWRRSLCQTEGLSILLTKAKDEQKEVGCLGKHIDVSPSWAWVSNVRAVYCWTSKNPTSSETCPKGTRACPRATTRHS